MADLARCLRRLVAISDSESDADLLDRFIADRDGSAFAVLVRRHGPMVLAVCRRVLRHRQDAEDAFQATFLVLARRAGAVKPRSLLGNWLYGVAYRTALGARRVTFTQRTLEARAAVMRADETGSDDTGFSPELREMLDRELAALPDVYRAAVVACDLEGLSRREAADRLGWTEGTLSSRLARARSLLARRLARYGLAVPVAGLAAVSGPTAVAGELADPTIRLGILVATGEAVVAPPVAALMEGVMGTMLLTKLKVVAAALVVACAVTISALAGWRADTVGAADPPKFTDAPKANDAPKRAPSDKERIAELERDRDRLLREVAELRDQLAKTRLEADRRLAQAEYARRIAEAQAALAAESAERLPGKGPKPEKAPLVDTVPPLPDKSAPALGRTKPDLGTPKPETPTDNALPPFPKPGYNPPSPDLLAPSQDKPAPVFDTPKLRPDPLGRVPKTPKPETPAENALPPLSKPPGTNTPPLSDPLVPSQDKPAPVFDTPKLRPDPLVLEPDAPRPKATKAIVRVYRVGDLAADEKEGDALARVLRAAVEPKSWGADAGVEYLPGQKVLVVRQTAKAHEEITELLQMLVQQAPRKR